MTWSGFDVAMLQGSFPQSAALRIKFGFFGAARCAGELLDYHQNTRLQRQYDLFCLIDQMAFERAERARLWREANPQLSAGWDEWGQAAREGLL